MNNKVMNTIYIACIVAVVGIMSWRDMHPKEVVAGPPSFPYYAGANITPEMIPADNMPITIAQGTFSYPRGKMVWTHQGMEPFTFAQRQVSLQFKFDGIPKDPAETIQKIQSVTHDWEKQGNSVTYIVIEYAPPKPDMKAYANFAKVLQAKFKMTNPIILGADLSWPQGAYKEDFRELLNFAPQFLIVLPKEGLTPALQTELKNFRYNTVLQFPAGTQPKDLDTPEMKKVILQSSPILTLDPQKPIILPKENIGLFPKL